MSHQALYFHPSRAETTRRKIDFHIIPLMCSAFDFIPSEVPEFEQTS